jgi:hypothetical protein
MANAVSPMKTAQPNHVAQPEASQQVKAGVDLGDMVWSVDKNAGLPPERKKLEAQLGILITESLNHFKIDNLFLAMVNGPNLFMICDHDEGVLYSRYMLEKYHLAITPKYISGRGFLNVYQIISPNKKKRGSGL